MKKILGCCFKDKKDKDKYEYININDITLEEKKNTVKKDIVKCSYEVNVIYQCSIATGGRSQIKINNIVFGIHTYNFNYFDYLNPNMIRNIEQKENIVIIHLDRFKIRHFAERSLIINMKTKEIEWCETSVDGKICRIARLTNDEISIY